MQLEPREYFTIVRQLDDPQLTGTFYVRVYIRNSRTDDLIETIDLEDKGNYRFTKEWQVSADSSGLGFYIDITSRVFTNAAYTNESDVFAREKEQHLIAKRYDPVFGRGGGVDVNYKKVKKIIQDEISKIKMPEPRKTDLSPVLRAIKGIKVSPVVKSKQVDLRGINALIQRVLTAIEELPKLEKADFTEIYSKLEKLGNNINKASKANNKIGKKRAIRIKKRFEEVIKEIKKYSFVMARVDRPIPQKKRVKKNKEDKKEKKKKRPDRSLYGRRR